MSPKTILIVDDDPLYLKIINALLVTEYQTRIATSGAKGLELAYSKPPPDLILLDVGMPDLDGHQVCAALKADRTTRELPVIFLTGRLGLEDELKGFALGAVDFITKPISAPTLRARVRTHLALTEARVFLRHQNQRLEDRVLQRTRELQERNAENARMQEATIIALASVAETCDNDTGNHLRRTQHYVKILARQLHNHSDFHGYISENQVDALFRSVPLHDLGNVGIPDQILLKPGKLTTEEFEVIKTHTRLGRDAIAVGEGQSDFFALAREISYGHHEKWDGSGYPLGLTGDQIPVSARLMAVADVYDALISKRPYKEAFPHRSAVTMIREGRGSHFDPVMVDAFDRVSEQFDDVACRFSDSDAVALKKAVAF